MNISEGTLLKALIARFGGDEKQYANLLDPSEKEVFEKCFTPVNRSFSFLFSETEWTREIHSTWLEEFPQPSQTSPFQTRLASTSLKTKILPSSLLPRQQLPPSAFNELLDLPREKLMQLIDFLGLYDLAADLKRVIDKSLLDKVRKTLSEKQLQFLHYAANVASKWTPAPLYLERWDGDKKSLFLLLHKRGLHRFGRALFLEDKSFKWHLTHKLDKGRGSFLMKQFAGKEDPDMISFFKGQLLQLMQRQTT